MAVSASVTNTFTSGTTALAAGVNTNFSDILTFLNSTGVGKYQAGTVDSTALASGAVGTTQLADSSVTSAKIVDGTITSADISSTYKDGAAGTVSLRSLGTGAAQAAAGNDSRFSQVVANGFSSARPATTDGSLYADRDLLMVSRYNSSSGYYQLFGAGPRAAAIADACLQIGGIQSRVGAAGFSTFGCLNGETLVSSGATDFGTNPPWTGLNTGATINTNSYIGTQSSFNAPANKSEFNAIVATDTSAITSQRVWIGPHFLITMLSGDSMSSVPVQGYMFRYSTSAGDTTWKFITYDGTTQTVTDTGMTVSVGNQYQFHAFYDKDGGLNWVIHSITAGTTVRGRQTTNLSASTSAHGVGACGIRNLAASARGLSVCGLSIALHGNTGSRSPLLGELPSGVS